MAIPENSSGGSVPELADRGLTSVPPMNVNSLADIPVQTYSNNLGFYNQVFTVAAQTAPSPETENIPEILTLASVGAEKDGAPVTQVRLNDRMQVRASHSLIGPDLDDLLVLFYDGDPAHGGKLFDTQSIPRIPADGGFVTRVPFQPRSCGVHTLFVKSVPEDGTASPVTNKASIDVNEDPIAELNRIHGVIKQIRPSHDPRHAKPHRRWYLGWRIKRRLLHKLWIAKRLFWRGHARAAQRQVDAVEKLLHRRRGRNISTGLADALVQDIERLEGCLGADRPIRRG